MAVIGVGVVGCCSRQKSTEWHCSVRLGRRRHRGGTQRNAEGVNVPFGGTLAMHPDLTTVQLDDALAESEMKTTTTSVTLQIVRTKFENVSALITKMG